MLQRISTILSEEPVTYLFKKLWTFSREQKPRLSLGILFIAVSYMMDALIPIVFALLLNEVQKNGITEQNLMTLLFMALLIPLIRFIYVAIRWFGQFWKNTAQYYTRIHYRNYLLEGIFDLPLDWHTDRDSGDTIDKINKATRSMQSFGGRVQNVIKVVVNFVTAFIAIVYFNATAALFAAVIMVGILYVVLRFDKVLIPKQKALNRFGNRVSAQMFDALSNVSSVIILHIKRPIKKNLNKVMRASVPTFYDLVKTSETKWFVSSILFNVLIVFGTLVIFFFGVVDSGSVVEVGTVSALFMYLSRMGDSFFMVTGIYGEMIRFKTNMQNVDDIEEHFVEELVNKADWSATKEFSVHDLHFVYDHGQGKQITALNGVSLSFKKGEKVALIGHSGSGKTTFLKVLHGLYEGAVGKITIDAKLTEKQFFEIDMGTTLVPQEPELFSSSIRENITFGLDYSDKEIADVTDLARFSEVIEQLPEGLESVVNEKGVNLSGGQKQRLALARALLFAQNKEIILLDESTSSVDPENEVKIYQNIFREYKGKTIIATIHKMNLLKYFDRIIMFDKGEVIDDGSFDQLMSQNIQFKSMWEDYIKSSQ